MQEIKYPFKSDNVLYLSSYFLHINFYCGKLHILYLHHSTSVDGDNEHPSLPISSQSALSDLMLFKCREQVVTLRSASPGAPISPIKYHIRVAAPAYLLNWRAFNAAGDGQRRPCSRIIIRILVVGASRSSFPSSPPPTHRTRTISARPPPRRRSPLAALADERNDDVVERRLASLNTVGPLCTIAALASPQE